ncbi:hypothetical protein J7643_16900 [bacterium]|nr:hypothetical protein [bacterium]
MAPVPLRLISLAAFTALCVTGCGLELIQTVGRLGNGAATSALPSWPVDLKVGLGEATLPLSKLAEASSSLPLSVEADQTYALRPDPKEIPAYKVAEALTVPATASAVPAPMPSMPALEQHGISGPALSFASLNLSNLPSGAPGLTIGDVIHTPGAPDVQLSDPIPFTPDPQVKSVGLGQLRGARLDAGSVITLKVQSDLGGDDRHLVRLALRDLTITSGDEDLNETWRVANPTVILQDGDTIAIPLDADKVVAGGLRISFRAEGALRAGLRLKQFSDAQRLSTSVDSTLRIKAISLAAQAIPTSTQSIGTLKVPEDGEIHSISQVTVASGSLTLKVRNGYGFHTRLNLGLSGIVNAQGQPLSAIADIPAGLPLSESRHEIPLSGTRLTGEPVTATLSGRTFDTEDGVDRLPSNLAPLSGRMAAFRTDPPFEAEVAISPLVIDSARAVVKKTITVATASTPVELPKEFTRLGVELRRVGLQLRLDNRSQLSGEVRPTIQAVLKDGSVRTLNYTGNTTFSGSETRGVTRTSVLDINETNSNLMELLNIGAKSLVTGAEVVIDTQGAAVPLTRDDQVSGKLAIVVPVSLVFKEIGPGKEAAPYDLRPATPLTLDAATKARLAQGQVERLAIAAEVDNGLRIPVDLHLLFSKQDDPFADPSPLVRTLSLGDGSATARSLLDFAAGDLPFFQEAKTVGLRLTSPGTKGQPVTLKSTDALRVRLVALLKVRVSAQAFGQ